MGVTLASAAEMPRVREGLPPAPAGSSCRLAWGVSSGVLDERGVAPAWRGVAGGAPADALLARGVPCGVVLLWRMTAHPPLPAGSTVDTSQAGRVAARTVVGCQLLRAALGGSMQDHGCTTPPLVEAGSAPSSPAPACSLQWSMPCPGSILI